jgi:hypothetical protein
MKLLLSMRRGIFRGRRRLDYKLVSHCSLSLLNGQWQCMNIRAVGGASVGVDNVYSKAPNASSQSCCKYQTTISTRWKTTNIRQCQQALISSSKFRTHCRWIPESAHYSMRSWPLILMLRSTTRSQSAKLSGRVIEKTKTGLNDVNAIKARVAAPAMQILMKQKIFPPLFRSMMSSQYTSISMPYPISIANSMKRMSSSPSPPLVGARMLLSTAARPIIPRMAEPSFLK